MHRFIFIFLSIVTLSVAPLARACDLCGCYTPQLEALPQATADVVFGQFAGVTTSSGRSWMNGLYGAVSEQFTYFGTIQVEGHEEANPTGQYLDSSITQLVAGYTFNSRFALQMNVPLIYRSFERPEGFAIDRGTESGLGDISLLAKFVAYHSEIGGRRAPSFDSDSKSPKMEMHEPEFTASVVLLAGIKFPTGDSSRLKEEFNEVETPGAPESGIHGHDLTLGTGSYDGIFGGQTSLRYRNWFFQGDAQFALRGDGRHQYDFANDISWGAGPGYYFIWRRDTILGLQFVVSGEHKDVDRFQGRPAEDTGITSLFLGPRVIAAFGRISGEIAVDLPVLIDNTALQIVPDYRIRGGIAIRF
jgi:hypothetical protein